MALDGKAPKRRLRPSPTIDLGREQQENVLKNLITDKYAEWHDLNLAPAENLVAVPEVVNLQQSWQTGVKLRPDLVQARLDLERSEILVKLDFNQLFPSLDVVGQYGYQGSGPEFSRAFGPIETPKSFLVLRRTDSLSHRQPG
jgi:outer membrane protein TolC